MEPLALFVRLIAPNRHAPTAVAMVLSSQENNATTAHLMGLMAGVQKLASGIPVFVVMELPNSQLLLNYSLVYKHADNPVAQRNAMMGL
jgi:hypothetical protein